MGFDTLRVVQVLWALGDVLLTGGAFAVLGVYGSDADKNCRYGGLFLWTLCGIAPAVLYILGFAITYLSRQLDARHPANWKLLTLLATANNITLGLLYEHKPASVCGSTVAKVLLASFGAVPVLGALAKQLVKGGAGRKRQFGAEAYQQEFLPSGTAAHSGSAKGQYP